MNKKNTSQFRELAAFVATVLSVASIAFAMQTPTPVRFSAGDLSRSVRNETAAAIDRACGWIVAAQNPTGYWGEADVLLTSLCSLALAGNGTDIPEGDLQAFKKALAWLESPASTNALSRSSASTGNEAALAWRDMALAVFSPETPTTQLLMPETPSLKEELAINESMRLRGKAVMPTSTNAPLEILAQASAPSQGPLIKRLDEAAMRWTCEDQPEPYWSDAESAWWFARSVNRLRNGELAIVKNGEFHPVSWRSRLANKWTTSQKTDARGNGHWNNSIGETAFAVLLLGEL